LARAAYEPRSFSTRAAAGALTSLVRTARRFGRATADYGHHEATRDPARTALALELLAARALALHVAPIMPSFAATLLAALGDRRPLAEQQFEDPPGGVAPGTRVTLDRSWFEPVR
jgi:methionyl-tRNA synthetase